MQKISTENWGNFIVGDLFDIHPTKSYKMINKDLLNGDKNNNPVVVNSAYNNGIGGYTTFDCTEKGNIITFSDTVDANTIFYQEKDFVGYPHVQGVYPLQPELWNKERLLFFISMFKAEALRKGFNFGNKFRRDIAIKMKIKLPITLKGEPDWQYMENYIKQVVEKSEKSLENLKRADNTKQQIDVNGWGEFRVGDLFEEVKAGYIGKSKKIGTATKSPDTEHTLPLTCAKYGNCGIMYYGKETDYIVCENVLAVIRDGAISTGMVYAEEKASVYSHSYFIKVRNYDVSFLTNQYLACILTKNIYPKYYRDNTCIWGKVKEEIIKLPVDKNNKPDWQYMENYMKNIISTMQNNLTLFQAA